MEFADDVLDIAMSFFPPILMSQLVRDHLLQQLVSGCRFSTGEFLHINDIRRCLRSTPGNGKPVMVSHTIINHRVGVNFLVLMNNLPPSVLRYK